MKIIIEEFGETLLAIAAGVICFILMEQIITKIVVVVRLLIESLM